MALPFTAWVKWSEGLGYGGMVELITVPSGQVLVVEAVSGYFTMVGGTTKFPLTMFTFGEGPDLRVFFFSSAVQGTTPGLPADHYGVSHATKMYVSSGTTLRVGIQDPVLGLKHGMISVSGHFEALG